MRRMNLVACTVLALFAARAQAQAPAPTSVIEVRAAGKVANPGVLSLADKPRLGTLARAAGVSPDAYVLGAAWLRSALRPQQARLKAGLLYEIGMIGKLARGNDEPALVEFARRWRGWVEAMPVTGRDVSLPTLEPHALRIKGADNRPLSEGDTLYYPPRPQTVRVLGAVVKECQLTHVGMQDAAAYLGQCPRSALADPDTLFVIEPDGRVFEQGIASWNRSPPMPVAPGAVLLVPLARGPGHLGVKDGFNRDLADFIATQPLSWSGSEP